MTRTYWRAVARSMPIALLAAATAAAQVPVARPDRGGATAATQSGAAPGAKAGAPKAGAAAISPISPVLAPPARQRACVRRPASAAAMPGTFLLTAPLRAPRVGCGQSWGGAASCCPPACRWVSASLP